MTGSVRDCKLDIIIQSGLSLKNHHRKKEIPMPNTPRFELSVPQISHGSKSSGSRPPGAAVLINIVRPLELSTTP